MPDGLGLQQRDICALPGRLQRSRQASIAAPYDGEIDAALALQGRGCEILRRARLPERGERAAHAWRPLAFLNMNIRDLRPIPHLRKTPATRSAHGPGSAHARHAFPRRY